MLKNRSTVVSRPWVWWAITAGFVGVALVTAYFVSTATGNYDSLSAWVASHPLEALSLAVSFVLTPLGLWISSRERLVLEPIAIRYVSGLEFPWSRSWTVHLYELESVSVKVPWWLPLPALWQLTLHTRSGARSLRVFQWVDPQDFNSRDFRALDATTADPDALDELLALMPLTTYLRAAGFAVSAPIRSPLSRA